MKLYLLMVNLGLDLELNIDLRLDTSLPLADHSPVPGQQKALKPLAPNLYP